MALENRAWILVVVAAVSLAISGAFLYVATNKDRDAAGSSAPAVEPVAPAPVPGPPGAKGVPTMEQAADRLAKRLERQDGSADDWALLARSYVELRQYDQAVRAFDRALKKTPNDPQLIKDAASARQAAQAPSTTR